MLSTAKDLDLPLLWATSDNHPLTCSEECFSFFGNIFICFFGQTDEKSNTTLQFSLAWHKCWKEEETGHQFLGNKGPR